MSRGAQSLLSAMFGLVAAASAHAQPALTSLPLEARVRLSAIYDFAVVGPYLYASERGIIRVLDTAQPHAVREVATLELERPRARMALREPYLYMRGFGAPLAVIDVSDPASPRWVRELPDLVPAPGHGFRLAGDIALLVRRDDAAGGALFLEILDLADGAAPRSIRTVELGVRASGEFGSVNYAGGRAYVLVGRPQGGDARSELIIVDVRNPRRAVIERRVRFPPGRMYRNLEVRGDLLYVLQWGRQEANENGLSIWRLHADAAEPELLGAATSTMLRYVIDLTLHAHVVYVTVKGVPTFVTVDVSDPRRPRIVHGHVENENWAGGLGMALAGHRLYVTGDQGAAGIFDVSVADAPRHLGRFHDGGAVREVLRTGGVAVLHSLTDLLFYDVSDTGAPRRVGRHAGVPLYWTGGVYQWNLAFGAGGSRLVVAYESIPAEVLDISDPSASRVLGRFEPRGLVHAVAVGATHAYLGYRAAAADRRPQPFDPATLAPRGGIQVVSLGAPEPGTTAVIELDAAVTDVALAGERLVATHPDGSLTVLDAGTAGEPRVVERVPGAGTAAPPIALRTARVALSPDGRFAYLSHAVLPPSGNPWEDGAGTFTVIELSDTAPARLLARLEFERRGGVSVPVAAADGRAAVLLGELGGVLLVDVRDPARPHVLAREPLPAGAFAEGLALDARRLYVGAWEDGLLVYALPPRR